MPDLNTIIAQSAAAMPGIPLQLIVIYAEELLSSGDPGLALAAMRASAPYDQSFAGNRRDDGSVRWTEKEYLSIIEAFDTELASYGINPAVFHSRYSDLIAGDVAPDEFRSRVSAAYGDLVTAATEIRDYYEQSYGVAMTEEAVFTAYLDPGIGEEILAGRIEVAEVGGAGLQHGFDISIDLAERLASQDLTGRQAGQVFAQAANQLPVLDVLARRHNDPDDTFDLNEFLAAAVEADPTQTNRLRRLFAQEAAMFGRGSVFRTDRETGAVSGLTSR